MSTGSRPAGLLLCPEAGALAEISGNQVHPGRLGEVGIGPPFLVNYSLFTSMPCFMAVSPGLLIHTGVRVVLLGLELDPRVKVEWRNQLSSGSAFPLS